MNQNKRAGRLRWAAWPIVFLLICISCSGSGFAKSRRRILIIGAEGVSWETLDESEKLKELTIFRLFKEDGAWGVLESTDPIPGSVIWASLATGMTQTEHGIVGDPAADKARSRILPNRFECLPLWEILTEKGVSTAQIGWPGSSKTSLSPLRVAEMEAYSTLKIAGMAKSSLWRDSSNSKPLHTWFAEKPSAESLMSARIARNSLENVARLAEDEIKIGTQVIMAFFNGPVSALNHGAAELLGIAQEPLPRPKITIEYLLELNNAIALLLAASGDDAYVFFVSDTPVPPRSYHGELPGTTHPIHGIFSAVGPDIEMGRQLETPTVLDLVPTVLAILGLPAAKDMPGRYIKEIFKEPPVIPARIKTYENLSRTDYPVGGDALRPEDMARIEKMGSLLGGDLERWKTNRNAYAYELIMQGKFSGAKNELDLDARRNAYNPMTLYPRALLLESVGISEVSLENLDDAMNALSDYGANPAEKALIGAVGSAAVRMRLARGSLAKAGENLEWAAARAPDEEPWDLWRVRRDLALHNKESAMSRLKAFIDRKGLSPQAALLCAEIDWRNNRKAKAVEVLEKALKDNPDDAGLLTRLGYIAHGSRDFEKAVYYYEKADPLKIPEDDRYIYASALNSLSRTDEALRLLEEIIRNRPLDRRAWTSLRQIKSGDPVAGKTIADTYQAVLAEHFAFEFLSGD